MDKKQIRVNLVIDKETWETFKSIEKIYYGRRLDWALTDCLKAHNKIKLKELKKNEE